jgi:hypothetical protein
MPRQFRLDTRGPGVPDIVNQIHAEHRAAPTPFGMYLSHKHRPASVSLCEGYIVLS